MQRNDNYIAKGLDLARRLGCHRPELHALAQFYYQGTLTQAQRDILYRMLAPVYAQAREHPELALFEVPHHLEGELCLGTLPTSKPVRLPLSALATGTLVIGTTGSGKTTLLLATADEVCKHAKTTGMECGLWVVDHQKADLEASISVAKSHGLRMGIAPPDLPFNPLAAPPGVSARAWATKTHAILSFALQLGETTGLYLRPILSEIYSHSACPTWNELIQAVQETESLPETVRRPLALKLQGVALDLPGLADVRQGFPIEGLERQLVYWPLYRMPRDHARLLYAWARWASYTRRIENRITRCVPDLVILEDEIAFAYNEESGNDFLSMLCAVQRSTGIAFIGANQSFNVLPQILANTNLKIIGRLASMPDVREASDLLTLNPEQRDWLLVHPQPGQFLAKMPSGYLQPFPFQARQPEVRPLTEEERDEALRLLHEELDRYVVRAEKPTPEPEDGEVDHPDVPAFTANISVDEQTLLNNCYEQPFLFHTQRARACGFNNNRMNRIKKALLKNGWVVEHELETCKPGARPKLLEVTEAGCGMLGRLLPAWNGRVGGFLHHYGKELASSFYAGQDYECRVEESLGEGLAVDVLARRGSERVAVEVQVGQDHAEENLAKLRGRVSRIEFLCFTAPVRNRLEDLVRGVPGVEVHHFSRYLKDLHRLESGLPNNSTTRNSIHCRAGRESLT